MFLGQASSEKKTDGNLPSITLTYHLFSAILGYVVCRVVVVWQSVDDEILNKKHKRQDKCTPIEIESKRVNKNINIFIICTRSGPERTGNTSEVGFAYGQEGDIEK